MTERYIGRASAVPVVADARSLPRRLWGVAPDAVEDVFSEYVTWIDEQGREIAALRYENARLRNQLEAPVTDEPVSRPYLDSHPDNAGHQWPGNASGPNLGRHFDD